MIKMPEPATRFSGRASEKPVQSGDRAGSALVRALMPGLELPIRVARALPMLPMIVVFGIALSVTVDGFWSLFTLQNMLRQISVVLIAATGETLVILIAGIDLSVGAIIGLGSVCGAFVMHATASPLLGVMTCVAVGMAVGAINGFGIAWVGLQPFIMTFGSQLTVRAAGFLVTGGGSVGGLPANVLSSGLLNIGGLPLVFLIGIVVAVLGAIVLSYTAFGQKIYLMGSNPRAAFFSGVDIKRKTFLVYLISGTLSGFAAFVFMMRLGDATPDAGDQLLLQIVGAVLLGGNAMTGGEGGMLRTITGALMIAMIMQGMEIAGAEFWDQLIVVGALVAFGSALGAWLSRRRTSETKVPVTQAVVGAAETRPSATNS
jgi:ribose transport system permease protein